MKKVLIFIFGASFCSSVGRLKRELNQNCPDLELWNQCATKCDQTLIECIQTCQNSTEITCISDCNRENIACETGKFDGHRLNSGHGHFPVFTKVKHARAMKNAQLVVSVAITLFVSKTMVPYWYWMMLAMA